MPRRIVLLGATGYTGGLAAAALVRLRMRPLLVGRSAQKLVALGARLGHGLDTVVVDLEHPDRLVEVLAPRDVVVNVAGSFARLGPGVVEAVIRRRGTYIDCATEPDFLLDVFDGLGPVAAQSGSALFPGFGHRSVAGSLAASVALERSHGKAASVDIGYFREMATGDAVSGGTRASLAHSARVRHFAWRDGRLIAARNGDRARTFSVHGDDLRAGSDGGLEHIVVPRVYPSLREVGVYVGTADPSRPGSRPGRLLRRGGRLPAVVRGWGARLGGAKGPDEAARTDARTMVIANTHAADGGSLSDVTLAGVNAYTFTAETLAWAALRAADGLVDGEGAFGPGEAFGLAGLSEACAGLASEIRDATEAG